MWIALVSTALAGSRLQSVTEKVELDAPLGLVWTKLATAPGVTTVEGAEALPEGEGVVLDKMGERVPATQGGAAGTFVVVAIDGPKAMRVRWEPEGSQDWRMIDFVLSDRGEGTEVEATVAWPADNGRSRREVTDALAKGLEAFKVTVDGVE